ncbi:MAG: hypothetical protein Kow00121_31880 [Elainellaceae cyanobacterium]
MVYSSSDQPQPEAVTILQAIYGQPSQARFGSAVFYERIEPGSDLETIALRYYQHFVGNLWEQYGESAWMSTWKQVYVRPDGMQPDIVAELGAIADPVVAQYVPILLLTQIEDYASAQKALAAVFNHPQVTKLRVYAIGDGAAMSGLLLAGCLITGDTTILISLLD